MSNQSQQPDQQGTKKLSEEEAKAVKDKNIKKQTAANNGKIIRK